MGLNSLNFNRQVPASRGLFSVVFTGTDGPEEKRPLPWVETDFDSTAVRSRGRRLRNACSLYWLLTVI